VNGLSLRHVVKHYRQGELVRAADGVTLDVQAGEVVALYGPSGSGKSTLLRISGGYLQPDSGTVEFDGQNVASFSQSERALFQRQDIGLIPQTFHLSPGASAIDNAALKLLIDRIALHEARKRALPWLERVGLGARLQHLPHQLSVGERQRVALARALANEPRLLLADEPTASQDRMRGLELLELIVSLSHERAMGVLLVTHDPAAARLADRTLVLRDGRVVEDMPAAEPASRNEAG
jgi:putative ABC transport system ATP-binding protein